MSTRIPVQLTRFIGREQEIGNITRLLAESVLLTLTGPGGCGKTRLAAAVATHVEDEYEGGAVWVDLASIAEESLVSQAVAKSVNVKEQPGQSVEETLADFLGEKRVLLILDNCEHLRQGCQQLITTLMAKTSVSLLTTSREPLDVKGERLYPVPTLSLPPRSYPPDDLDGISQFEAIQLFVERAQRVLPAFALTAVNSDTVINICRQLDGLALAIELAAARVNVLTVSQIVARLDDHFALLAPAEHITHSPHQTLRAAFDWSYKLLTEREQRILRRLSVFSGGCTLNEAETVCTSAGVEQEKVLDLLASLVNKSLVTAVTLHRNEARYKLLQTIRHYGQEKLEEAGEWAGLKDRHLQCFLELAEQIESRLKGEDQKLWLNRLADDYDNIRAALRWSLRRGRIEQGMRIANALYQYWTVRDFAEEGLDWLEQLLAQADENVPAVVRATALAYAVNIAAFRGNHLAMESFGQEAAAFAASIGNRNEEALMWTFAAQSFSARMRGDHEAALDFGMREIELIRRFKDSFQLGMSLTIYSFMAMSLRKYDEAHAMLDEGLPLLRQAGNPYRLAMALNFSGDLARCEQDYEAAQTAYEESIALLREIESVRDLASALHNLGHACLHLGDAGRATILFEESLALHQEQGNRPGMTECLLGFAALAIVSDLPAVGACLLAAAAAIGGRHVTSEWAATSMEYEHYLERARAGLSDSTFRSAQTTGQRLTLDQAVAMTADVVRKVAAAQQMHQQLDQLTPREREVATLIAEGRSNDDIATELVLSKRTVETHITRIRAKLDFSERAQIVRWAIAAGLVPINDQFHL